MNHSEMSTERRLTKAGPSPEAAGISVAPAAPVLALRGCVAVGDLRRPRPCPGGGGAGPVPARTVRAFRSCRGRRNRRDERPGPSDGRIRWEPWPRIGATRAVSGIGPRMGQGGDSCRATALRPAGRNPDPEAAGGPHRPDTPARSPGIPPARPPGSGFRGSGGRLPGGVGELSERDGESSAERISGVPMRAVVCAVCLVGMLPMAGGAQAPESATELPATGRQEDPSVTGGPPVELVPDGIPAGALPETEDGGDDGVPPAFRVPRSGEGVRISDLPTARPGWTGVLDEDDGGLGWSMWDGTDAALAARLLVAVPDEMQSAAMRSLTRRLLLSRAATPARPPRREVVQLTPDGAPADTDTGETAHFFEERVHLLVRLADREGLELLARAAASAAVGTAAQERLLEARVLVGNPEQACAEVLERLAAQPSARLRMALVTCQIRQGARDAAHLSLQLLEGAFPADAPLPALALAVLDGTPLPEGTAFPDEDYLALALLASGGEPFVRRQNAAGLPVLRAIAEGPSGDPVRRIFAAEQTARAGALRDRGLAETYAAAAFTPEQLRSAGTEADAVHPVLGRALLFQAALQATTAIDRARFLRLLWDRADPDPGFAAMARATAPAAATVKPRPDLAWFSVAAARALLAGGRYAEAGDWIAMLAGSADLDFVLSGQLYALFPALALAGRPVPEPYEVFPREEVRATPPAAGPRADRAQSLSRLLVVLEAMDIPVPRGSWITLLDDTSVRTTATIPSAPARYQLRDAVAGKRVAETVLFVLSILGSGGPVGADPLTLNAAIRSLRAVGLVEDARAVALEAVI